MSSSLISNGIFPRYTVYGGLSGSLEESMDTGWALRGAVGSWTLFGNTPSVSRYAVLTVDIRRVTHFHIWLLLACLPFHSKFPIVKWIYIMIAVMQPLIHIRERPPDKTWTDKWIISNISSDISDSFSFIFISGSSHFLVSGMWHGLKGLLLPLKIQPIKFI